MMEVRGVKEGVECITVMVIEGSFMKVVGSDGNVNG